MKKLNKTGPSADPWGTPLVTSLFLFLPVCGMLSPPSRLSSREGKQLTYLVPAEVLWLMTDFPEAEAHTREGGEASGGPHEASRDQEA